MPRTRRTQAHESVSSCSGIRRLLVRALRAAPCCPSMRGPKCLSKNTATSSTGMNPPGRKIAIRPASIHPVISSPLFKLGILHSQTVGIGISPIGNPHDNPVREFHRGEETHEERDRKASKDTCSMRRPSEFGVASGSIHHPRAQLGPTPPSWHITTNPTRKLGNARSQ